MLGILSSLQLHSFSHGEELLVKSEQDEASRIAYNIASSSLSGLVNLFPVE
jgi:hypothetical protein